MVLPFRGATTSNLAPVDQLNQFSQALHWFRLTHGHELGRGLQLLIPGVEVAADRHAVDG